MKIIKCRNESALSMVNAGYDAAAGWRDTTVVDNFLKKRAELYGIDASRSANGMWNFIVRNKDVDTMLDMEKAAAKARENKDISDNQLRKWAETFGFDVNDSEQFDYFARWFSYRFLIFGNSGIIFVETTVRFQKNGSDTS